MELLQNGRIPLTDEQKAENHRKAQAKYMENQKMGLVKSKFLEEQIIYMNSQLVDKQAYITILQSQINSEVNQKNTSNMLYQQIINDKEAYKIQIESRLNEALNTISTLNQQVNDKNSIITQLQSQIPNNSNELQQQNAELRNQIPILESRVSEKSEELNLRNVELSNLRNSIPQLESRYQQEIGELSQNNNQLNQEVNELRTLNNNKDQTITQLEIRLSGCVTEDIVRRLQELSNSLNDKTQQAQLCLQSISQLTSENSNLKSYRDIVSDLNSKYPKILASFISELQQPGNQSFHPEINNWAREQLSNITPNDVLSLSAFRNLSPVNAFPIMNQQIFPNPNIPNVSLQTNTNIPTVPQNQANAMVNDPNFQSWLNLYNSNMKNSNEYSRLYQNLRNRYGESPVKIVKQYT